MKWTPAPDDVKWTASLVPHAPKQWGEFHKGILRLKDTRGKYWRNRLERPNKFVYVFPTTAKKDWEKVLLSGIKDKVQNRLKVQLFSTPGSRNEYYGEWVVKKMVPDVIPGVSELHLLRLQHQTDEDVRTATGRAPYRSRNECAHAALLDKLFPADAWIVKHEPETLLDLHEPSVVDGVARTVTDMGRSYTCDFVVASRCGTRRVCIESKPCREHVTEEALAKCRVLRDATLTRVVFLVGGGEDVEWLDMGPPGAPQGSHVWREEIVSLM